MQPWDFFDNLPSYQSGQAKSVMEAIGRFADDWQHVARSDDIEKLVANLNIVRFSGLEVVKAVTALRNDVLGEKASEPDVVYFAYKSLVREIQNAGQMVVDGVSNRQKRDQTTNVEHREFFDAQVDALLDQVAVTSRSVVAAAQLFLWAVQNTLILYSPT